MRITESQVAMVAQHQQTSLVTKEVQTRAWVGSTRPNFEGQGASATPVGDRVTLSVAALSAFESTSSTASVSVQEVSGKSDQDDKGVNGDARLMLLRALVERVTGRRISLIRIQGEVGVDSPAPSNSEATPTQAPAGNGAERAGWGVEIDAKETRVEAERTQFAAAAQVRTADGRTLTLTAELSMSRESVTVTQVSIRAGDAVVKDPLVLNFSGTAAQLGSDALFDLNSDGQADRLRFVGAQSAVLYFDKDNNGVATNGSELFGPTTGDGFAELAKLDGDANSWIDEGDAAFSSLMVWRRNAGVDTYQSLAAAGVGAIYTGSVATPFTVKEGGETAAQVRSTGLFLTEAGAVGTTQQVDLAMRPATSTEPSAPSLAPVELAKDDKSVA